MSINTYKTAIEVFTENFEKVFKRLGIGWDDYDKVRIESAVNGILQEAQNQSRTITQRALQSATSPNKKGTFKKSINELLAENFNLAVAVNQLTRALSMCKSTIAIEALRDWHVVRIREKRCGTDSMHEVDE